MLPVLAQLIPDDGVFRVGPDPRRVAHHIGDPGPKAEREDQEPQHQPVAQRHPGRRRRDPGGKCVGRRSKRPDPGAQHDRGHRRRAVEPGPDHHRDHDGIEGKALLGHPIGGAARGKGRHQDRDHVNLPPLQRLQKPADPGVDGPRSRHHHQEPPDDQHEERYVDGVRRVLNRIVKPFDRRHQDIDPPLRIGFDLLIGARNRRLTPQRLVHGHVV